MDKKSSLLQLQGYSLKRTGHLLFFKRLLLLLIYSSFLLHHSSLLAQHPSWQHFSIIQGLPSNEVYFMIQDSRGMLWFSTEQGICRFNGYEFTRPVDTSATATSSKFQIVEDAKHRIWFMNLDVSLSFIENDTVHPAILPDRPEAYKKNNTTYRFAIGTDGSIWLPSRAYGILILKPDSTQQVVQSGSLNTIVFTEVNGNVLTSIWKKNETDKQRKANGEMIHWQNGHATSLGSFPVLPPTGLGSGPTVMTRLKNGDFIGCHGHTCYIIRDNKLIWQGLKDVRNAGMIFEDSDGSILMSVSAGKNAGLLHFLSVEAFMQDKFVNILPGKRTDRILRDREGGLWVSTADEGVFYCKNSGLDLFDEADGLPDANVKTLASDGVDKIYAGLRQLDIVVFQQGKALPVLLPRPPIYEMKTVRFDNISGRLWCSSGLHYLEKGHWHPVLVEDQKEAIGVKKLTVVASGKHWWMSSAFGFFSLDLSAGTASRIFKKSINNVRTFSVTPDNEGNLWVTLVEGLQLFRNGRFELPPFQHPALRFPARNVALLPAAVGGGMAISLLGGGLLIRDAEGKFTNLGTTEGLTANWLSDILVSPAGIIYAWSNKGLNILTYHPDGSWHIEKLTVKHGLPSNQVNDVALLGDEIWVATDAGIARFSSKPATAPMPSPQLEYFRVNNRDTLFSNNTRLAYNQNNISLRFFSLHFRSGGDIPYRYRLLGADTVFVYTHTRELSFIQLPAGKYSFEVQAQNEDGVWSNSAIWSFEIRPPWWATWWFRLLAVASIASILIISLWLFYKNRLRVIREEAVMREKMRELQNTAMRAQMNPHFIFNCLASIQYFIAENDVSAATRYLARFARLVRLALHGSLDGSHSLADEVSMLENYLALEQLRFRDRFKFDIRVEKDVEMDELQIPPMLVQPFVENAILHGMKNMEQGGIIEVVFSKKQQGLEVTVSDNGPGTNPTGHSAINGNGHKSVGIALTKNRLELLSEKSGENTFTQETLWTPEGSVAGYRVSLLLPLL